MAIWGAIQSYNFDWQDQDKRLTLVRPSESLIIVGDEMTIKSDFEGITSCIKAEFERLRKSAKKQADLRAGKVVYVDVKETAEPNDG